LLTKSGHRDANEISFGARQKPRPAYPPGLRRKPIVPEKQVDDGHAFGVDDSALLLLSAIWILSVGGQVLASTPSKKSVISR
jgi:hypothetical protein